ncbi:hypothetical protein BDZ85DRAFT_22209 [Elsinoe ampelina]|uniref:Uncharacterized protein n=1 Tax=Elsinoe ampelina TaxID=302913 RepID=A0A6A6G5X0_9PEZI|nr:hypothetical protein BDZ85DRAFT_22209 [Elsinoe ampelina]
MAAVDIGLYRAESMELDIPPADRPHRQLEPFDVNELCRRLEAYRLELKLEQVRQRSKQLQDKRSSNLTYQPRYASRLSLHSNGEIARPNTAGPDTKSRRQSRYHDYSDKSDRSDRSDKSDDDRVDSGRSSQWLNPKQLLAAREKGMSENEALHHLSQERSREEAEFTKARKAANRRSFFLEPASASRLNRQPSTKSTADKQSPERKPSARKNRALSTAFENITMPDLHHIAPPMPRNPYLSPQQDENDPSTDREAKKSHRKSWRPAPADRHDWAQASQTCAQDDAERQSFLGRLARRSSRFIPSASPATGIEGRRPSARMSFIPGTEGRPGTRAGLMSRERLGSVAEGEAAPTVQDVSGARAAKEKRAMKRPSAPWRDNSKDSAVALKAEKGEVKGRDGDKSPPKKRRSLFDLFRRHRD